MSARAAVSLVGVTATGPRASAGPGRGEAGPGPFPDEITFELGDRAKHVQEQPSAASPVVAEGWVIAGTVYEFTFAFVQGVNPPRGFWFGDQQGTRVDGFQLRLSGATAATKGWLDPTNAAYSSFHVVHADLLLDGVSQGRGIKGRSTSTAATVATVSSTAETHVSALDTAPTL
jgi:hypothetical protein